MEDGDEICAFLEQVRPFTLHSCEVIRKICMTYSWVARSFYDSTPAWSNKRPPPPACFARAPLLRASALLLVVPGLSQTRHWMCIFTIGASLLLLILMSSAFLGNIFSTAKLQHFACSGLPLGFNARLSRDSSIQVSACPIPSVTVRSDLGVLRNGSCWLFSCQHI